MLYYIMTRKSRSDSSDKCLIITTSSFQVGARFSVRRTGLKKQLLISIFLVKIAISFFKSKDSYHSKYFEKCVDLK